jgi:hypothetical protein
MASLSDLVSAGSLKPMGVLATVDRAPSDADDTLDVLYTTDAGQGADEKALRWASRGGALPAEGDDVLLFLDSLGDPWGIVWPSDATPDVPGSLAALDARLDTLEAKRRLGGLVNGAGTFPQTGPGWSVARTALGQFAVTFSPVFTTTPTVVVGAASSATSGGNHAGLDHAALPTVSGFGAKCTDAPSAAFVDIYWSFVAQGS